MLSMRQWSAIIAMGALFGVVLSMALPPRDAHAAETVGCRCDDDYAGKYKCNLTQTACLAGTHACEVICA